jgi:tetratricopeptide (TPR) repeat protein
LDQALAVARELKNDALISRILDAEGDNGLYRGDFTQAKTLYQQALEAARRSGQPEPLLISKIELTKLQAQVAGSTLAIQSLRNLAQQADTAGLKYLAVECSVYVAEALMNNKKYAAAREQLQEILGRSEKLGLRFQNMKIHYLLAAALRSSGDSTEATGQYREVLRLLDQATQEPGADHLLDRSDLHAIYSDSTYWAQAGKS